MRNKAEAYLSPDEIIELRIRRYVENQARHAEWRVIREQEMRDAWLRKEASLPKNFACASNDCPPWEEQPYEPPRKAHKTA